jgi:ankyrin repeat protein
MYTYTYTYLSTTGTANITIGEASTSLQLFELFINVTCCFPKFNLQHLTYEMPFLLADKDRVLAAACRRGEHLYVKLLVSFGADVHWNYDQPLYEASLHGHTNIADLLISCRADVHAREGVFVQNAAWKGHAGVVSLLVEHQADITIDNHYALCKAVNCGKTEVVKVLLNHGADLGVLAESPLCSSFHPLRSAVVHDQVELFKLLIEHGVDTSAESICKAFEWGHDAHCGSVDMLKLLLPYTANTPLKVTCDLSKIVKCGDVEGLKFCFQHCKDSDVIYLYFGLSDALDAGQDECVQLMMEHELCTEKEFYIAISRAIQGRRHELLLKLLQQGRLGLECIHQGLLTACTGGNAQALEMLLDHGADINANYLLHTAAEAGHVDIVNLLLARGANVKVQPGVCSEFLRDACVGAARAGHGHVVELLLKHGMEPWKALQYLTYQSSGADPVISEMLLQHAVQIDATKAAVHCATGGRFEMTQYCLELDAGDVASHFNHCPETWTRNSEGAKLLELMISLGCDVPEKQELLSRGRCIEAVKLLVEHGANVDVLFKESMFQDDLDPNILKYLVENGADVTRHFKQTWSNVDVFKLGIELGSDVTRHDFCLLDTAVYCKEIDVMKLLLAYGGDAHVTARDNQAVVTAAGSGNLEMVKILVEHGAGLCSPNPCFYLFEFPNLEPGKYCAFFHAVSSGHVEIVVYLVDKHGQDVTVQDNMAVKMASKLANLEMVKVLHGYGADLTAIDTREIGEVSFSSYDFKARAELRMFLMDHGVK